VQFSLGVQICECHDKKLNISGNHVADNLSGFCTSIPEWAVMVRLMIMELETLRLMSFALEDVHQDALKYAARRHLTRHTDLEQLLHGAKEELDVALAAEIPDCDGYYENLNSHLQQITNSSSQIGQLSPSIQRSSTSSRD
jgi:hypothetical protein